MCVWRGLLLMLATTTSACASAGFSSALDEPRDDSWPVTGVPPAPMQPVVLGGDFGDVQVTYLGSGGFIVRAGSEAILTGPFFSNPSMLQVLFASIRVDTARVDRGLEGHDLSDVDAVLIGHGHYDHLMDVPYIVRTYRPEARVYGAPTVRNLILSDMPDPNRVVAIETDSAATRREPGQWYSSTSGRFRWMAIRSDHSKHFWRVELFQGHQRTPRPTLPSRAGDWKVGETYAYLIEVLRPDGEPALRIHYNDSPGTADDGFPPDTALDGDVPLVALLTAPGHKWEDGYPGDLVEHLEPDYVIASHWEDFFTPQEPDPKPIFGTFYSEFVEKMNRLPVDWTAPAPGAVLVFTGS